MWALFASTVDPMIIFGLSREIIHWWYVDNEEKHYSISLDFMPNNRSTGIKLNSVTGNILVGK